MNYDLTNISLFVVLAILLVALFMYYRNSQSSSYVEERLDSLVENKSYSAIEKKDKSYTFFERVAKMESGISQYLLGLSRASIQHYQLQFEQAGWSGARVNLIVPLIRLVSLFVGVIICLSLYFFATKYMFLNMYLNIAIYGVIIFLSIRFYDIWIDRVIKSRYQRIEKSLYFSIDLLSICVRAGYSIDRAFEIIAEQVSYYNIDMCVDFMRLSIELSIMPNRQDALRNFAQRLDIPLIKILVGGLIQAEEQGAPMARTLLNLSQEFSKQKLASIDEQVSKIPTKILLPMALFCLPGFLLFIMGPIFANITRSGIMSS